MADSEQQQVLWFAETRPKISSLQVTCGFGKLNGIKTKSESTEIVKCLTLDILPDRFLLKNTSLTKHDENLNGKTRKEHDLYQNTFPLDDTRVIPTSCQGLNLTNGNEIHLRLNTTKSKQSHAPLYSSNFVSDEEMKLLKTPACQFHCHRCGASLLRNNMTFGRVLEMPSENWQELVDTWLCHGSHELPDTMRHPLAPSPDDCLVAKLYILLNYTAFEHNAIFLVQEQDETVVRCYRCRHLLGSGTSELFSVGGRNEEDETNIDKTIRLYKYAVDLMIDNQKNLIWRSQYTLEMYISGKLLSQCQAHMNYQFIIEGAENGCNRKTYCLLWVLTTDSCIISNVPDNGGHTAKELLKGHVDSKKDIEEKEKDKVVNHTVLKILYKISKENDMESTLPVWEQMMTAETLTFHHEICLHLIMLLTASTQKLPPSLRTMNDFKVGFLQLC